MFLFLLPVFLMAQNKPLDSLTRLFKREPIARNKLELLSQMVNIADRTDLALAADYSRKGVSLAKKTGDVKWLPKFHEMLGRNYANQLQLDSAWVNFTEAMKGYLAIGDKKGQATTYFKMGWVHKKKGELELAMQSDLKALRLMELINDKKGIAAANDRLADDVMQQGRAEESLAYAKKNIDFCIAQGLQDNLVYAYFSAANASIVLGKNEAALNYYDQTLQLARALNFEDMSLSDFMNGRGNAFKRLGRYQEALIQYNTAMARSKKANYNNAIIALTANLGEVNLLMGNYSEALKYQLETVSMQEKDGDLSNLTENYDHVSTIYEKLGNYPLSLHYAKKARTMRDSVNKIASDKAMSELMTQYESGKKEATIAAQKQQISQQRLVQWLSIGVAILLSILLIFGYRSYVARTKSNRLLAIKNAENELLMKEIHHRVKNNLELVKSLISLQSAHLEDSVTKDAMIASQNRVQSMGIIHQKLYQGENLGSIEMKDYFINLSEGILDTFNAEEKVTIECIMEELELDVDTAVPIGLIVNELLTNSLKYAFPNDATGKIRISLQSNSKHLTLTVADNGVGKIADDRPKGTGFGTQLIQLLTQQLNGTIEEQSQNGTAMVFHFKTKLAA